MIDILKNILAMIGVWSFLYVGALAVEHAKMSYRRKMKVCDNCYAVIKKIQDE